MNDEAVIRGIVTETIRHCSKSREVIAQEMTTLLGERVTARMLNSYTSEAAEKHRWPAQYTRALCHATGDWRLVRCISERAGFHLITKAEAKLFELGRQYLIEKRAAQTIAALERELAGVAL
ncbi:hypothetical protein FTO74_14295 [Granulicella sp. WH15]|uniref:hypothetical protein n=1 Tax=Granulicella sp. WH15 TaxID=2602070 RepID=UPI0013672C80|nr:hypothetical protein [Granulicella sp. WH15]QHN04402.1 hypothetical protein FTO74_14295 [Granulicella sp. WH15]